MFYDISKYKSNARIKGFFKENLLNEKHPSHSKILLGLRIRPNVT